MLTFFKLVTCFDFDFLNVLEVFRLLLFIL